MHAHDDAVWGFKPNSPRVNTHQLAHRYTVFGYDDGVALLDQHKLRSRLRACLQLIVVCIASEPLCYCPELRLVFCPALTLDGLLVVTENSKWISAAAC